MEKKPQKSKKRKFNMGRLKVFILLGVLIYAGITLASLQSKISAQTEKSVTLRSTEESRAQELEYLNNEENYVGSDEFVEKYAREKLGWLKEGETKYVEAEDGSVAPGQSDDPDAQPTDGATPPPDAEPTPEDTASGE